MSTSLAEAKAFLKFRATKKVPVMTASVLPHQASVRQIRKELRALGKLRAVHLHGPGSHKSPYGGIWFYGIHLVDLMVELFGPEPRHAQMVVNKQCSTAVCTYDGDLTVTMSFLSPERHPFTLSAVGIKGDFHAPITYDPNPYLGAARIFTGMFRTGTEPFDDRRMLAPLAVLDALGKSLARKTRVKIAAV
jgi:predicted dehydrogenase